MSGGNLTRTKYDKTCVYVLLDTNINKQIKKLKEANQCSYQNSFSKSNVNTATDSRQT